MWGFLYAFIAWFRLPVSVDYLRVTGFIRYRVDFEVCRRRRRTPPWQAAFAAENRKNKNDEHCDNGSDGCDDGECGHIWTTTLRG